MGELLKGIGIAVCHCYYMELIQMSSAAAAMPANLHGLLPGQGIKIIITYSEP